METWNYTNRPDFIYKVSDTGNLVNFKYRDGPAADGKSLRQIKAIYLSVGPEVLDYSIFLPGLIHELSHVYTLATGAASNYPGPLAVAHLYFAHLADTTCPRPLGAELFAETADVLVELHKHYDGDFPRIRNQFTYWPACSPLFVEPTLEGREVAASAFAGEMPQWLYDTFQLPDGRLDYKAIWAAVKAVNSIDRISVVYQLKDAFGGYCSDWAAERSAFGNSSLRQPWRDGGC